MGAVVSTAYLWPLFPIGYQYRLMSREIPHFYFENKIYKTRKNVYAI